MSVIRVNKSENFTVMSNYHLRDRDLSLKAKGLLSQMLSLPNDWDYTISGLVAINKENETAINSTLTELKNCGYLVVTKLMPDKTKTGRIAYIYDIYEQPTEKQGIEKQGVENQGVEFQGVENQGQLNTNNKDTNNKNTDILNNNNNIYQSEFEEIWKKYPNKKGKEMALKAYIKARKNNVSRETIEQGIENYAEYCRNKDKQYIKHGSTWFNQQCWQDEYTTENKPVKKSTFDVLRELYEEAEDEETGNIKGNSVDMFELPEYKG